ncbi:MAG TPA: hypothetical protein VIC28_01545 [Thermoanaerobaculia bacterium]|jgi:hypothetical protein
MSGIARALCHTFAILGALAVPSLACSSTDGPREDRMQVTAAPATLEIGTAPAGRLVLHLDDVQLAEGQAATFRVFVNRPDATAATPADAKGFVQELYLVPRRSRPSALGARQPGQNLALPLPAGLVGPGERITVTLVPVGADAEGRLNQPGQVDITLKRPYVTAER